MEFYHKPVLLEECIENLNIQPDGIYVDATLGGGGHSQEILARLSEKGRLIGLDQDENAIQASTGRLKSEEKQVTLVRANFVELESVLKELQTGKVNGILMDLGVSSHQLDEAERGFSYQKDAFLDMRMDQRNSFTAADVVNTYDKLELERIIREYGEEKWASRIAAFLVREREVSPIQTTGRLSEIIKGAIPAAARREGPHPAKRTFQAIRIEVNHELEILGQAVQSAVKVLKPEGRLCIITFHSLEDRIIKNEYNKLEKPCTCPPNFPICVCGKQPVIKVVTKKPITEGQEKLEENPRARSAKLRVAEKL